MIFIFITLSMVGILFLMTAATFSLFQLQVVSQENWRLYHRFESQYVFVAQQYQQYDEYSDDEPLPTETEEKAKPVNKKTGYRLSPKIPIRDLIETLKSNGSFSLEQEQLYNITLSLMEQIYGALPFYQEYFLVTGRTFDLFLKNIFDAIVASEERGEKISSSERLAQLQMPDAQDQFLLYKILRGSPYEHWSASGNKVTSIAPSLIHFIDLRKSKHQISLYKAPFFLLKSILNDQGWAEQIQTLRMDLYKQMRAEAITKEEASAQFKDYLLENTYLNRYQELFDLRVSISMPGKTTFYKTIIRDEKE